MNNRGNNGDGMTRRAVNPTPRCEITRKTSICAVVKSGGETLPDDRVDDRQHEEGDHEPRSTLECFERVHKRANDPSSATALAARVERSVRCEKAGCLERKAMGLFAAAPG